MQQLWQSIINKVAACWGKFKETLCPAHASSATDGTYMPVNLTDFHVYDAQIAINQAKDSILQNSQLLCRAAHVAERFYEAACVDVAHVCSAVFYDSGPFMPDDAAESEGLYCVMST